jgi:hypothetical protein
MARYWGTKEQVRADTPKTFQEPFEEKAEAEQ